MMFLMVCLLLIVYPYILYPALLWGASNFFKNSTSNLNENENENVAFLICVYNGASYIEKKLDNVISLDEFSGACEIIIVSDGSDDDTDKIVTNYNHPSVKLIQTGRRMGKALAENMALEVIDDRIIVFTDVSSLFEKSALTHLLKAFQDDSVGCVSTTDVIVSQYGETSSAEEGAYVRYEMFLRRLESQLGILVGASGSGYACRREFAVEIPAHLTRDMHVPLLVRERGSVSLSSDAALCYIAAQPHQKNEFSRKIRTFTGGIDTLIHMKQLLNPFRFGFFSISMISHKVLRWLGGVFMALFFVQSLLLLENAFYVPLFVVQVALYLYCFVRYKADLESTSKLLNLAYFFVMTNVAATLAWKNHFIGKKFTTWQPTKR